MAEYFHEEITEEIGSEDGSVVLNEVTMRRHKKTPWNEDRPVSLELETDWTNTETKLVVLDFLSTEYRTTRKSRNDGKRKSQSKVSKSSSDGSSHESYRYAKLAKSAIPLRKQYSLRLKKDLDEYLKQRGKSMGDLSSYNWSSNRDEGMVHSTGLLHQRSYTEGETYMNTRRTERRMSDELKKGIKEFNTSKLKHVAVEDKTGGKYKESRQHRPDSLSIPFPSGRRISPVLSPESQVAARLEYISQEILNDFPDLFNEQISKVSLQGLTYEMFASTARKVLEKYPGGWTRVALVCYFARELALEDESTDEQLANLVELSSKFISDTSAEWIASQGGWGALEENDEALSPSLVRKKLQEEPDLVDGIMASSPNDWIHKAKYYGLAALAVGMTVAYSVMTK